ncbi:MAG: ATPase domain-containing protein [Halobacteria archaeon]|nr:ATPase domain-containing protein [Halobacteria archaeon]
MYDVSNITALGPIKELEPGTTLLISGPVMSGKRGLALEFLAQGSKNNEASIVISTDKDAESILEEYEETTGDSEPSKFGAGIGVIDCYGSGKSGENDNPTRRIRHVSSPSDLTGLSIQISELIEEFEDAAGIRIAMVSVSTLLMYLDTETVFKFIHVFVSRIRNADGVAFFVLDSSSVEPTTLSTLKQPFDGVIEVRETDEGDGREIRVVGLKPQPTEWSSIEA